MNVAMAFQVILKPIYFSHERNLNKFLNDTFVIALIFYSVHCSVFAIVKLLIYVNILINSSKLISYLQKMMDFL